MDFISSKEGTLTIEDGCHKCPSGQQGKAITTEKYSEKYSGSGISHESNWNGRPQDDTRIELEFEENGNYYLIAKGTSLPTRGNKTVNTRIEGICDNKNETKTDPVTLTIPLRVVFGPFKGKPTDKVLKENDTKTVKIPSIDETNTYRIEFNLKHD